MQQVLVNGIAADYVSVADRGLHYGDGLFETIACAGTHAYFLDRHLQRMENGARILDIPFPGRERIRRDIDRLLQARSSARSVIKLMLTRGSGKRGYRYDNNQHPTRICMLSPWPDYVALWAQHGKKARFCRTQASVNAHLAGIKSLNRLENVLASSELGTGYDEGFLCDIDGNVIEGTMSNVFAVVDDVLLTPDLSRSGIPGIMRDQVIASAKEIGFEVEAASISRDELTGSREIFISNSVIGICGVKQLEKYSFDCTTMTEAIHATLKKRIDSDAKTAA